MQFTHALVEDCVRRRQPEPPSRPFSNHRVLLHIDTLSSRQTLWNSSHHARRASVGNLYLVYSQLLSAGHTDSLSQGDIALLKQLLSVLDKAPSQDIKPDGSRTKDNPQEEGAKSPIGTKPSHLNPTHTTCFLPTYR